MLNTNRYFSKNTMKNGRSETNSALRTSIFKIQFMPFIKKIKIILFARKGEHC